MRVRGSAPISAALEAMLPKSAKGVDAVLAELARRLAAQLDDQELAPYVLPRLVGELRAVLAEMGVIEQRADEAADARRLLAEVLA